MQKRFNKFDSGTCIPPDFGKTATRSGISNKKKKDFSQQSEMPFILNSESVQPKVSNFIAPQFYAPSSKTPSDSLKSLNKIKDSQ